jgi:fumarate hydratase subunit alpha
LIAASQIASAVREAVPKAAFELRPDVLDALRTAVRKERSARGRSVLEQIVLNAEMAATERLPLCQDTGTVRVAIAVGTDECLTGDVQAAVDEAVRDAYLSAGLRMSVARDALLDRSNTTDNTPAFIEIARRSGVGATVTITLKGGGSDNASALAMLAPSDGWQGVRAFVLKTICASAASACPPLIVGVGVGGTFDTVAALSKKALLVPLDAEPADDHVKAFQAELLAAINATGIGPAGLGGDVTALGVRLLTAPCHIAALPVAINLGCHSMRSVTVEVLRQGAGS